MAESALEVKFVNPSRKPISFATPNDALAWAVKFSDAYAWLHPLKPNQTTHEYNGNFAQQIRNTTNSLKEFANRWTKENSNDARQNFEQTLRAAVDTQFIPLADDPITKLAEKLALTGDFIAAINALAAHSGRLMIHSGNMIPPSIWTGIVAANALRLNIDPTTQDAIRAGLESLRNELMQGVQEIEKQRHEIMQKANKLISEKDRALTNFSEATSKKWNEKIEESITSIKSTEAAYTQQMKLQAAVSYWGQQQKDHSNAKSYYLFTLIAFIIAVAFGAFKLEPTYFDFISKSDPQKLPYLMIVTGSFSLLVLTTLFWIGRVLVRLYLSSQHLAVDARERVVMIKTFLALLKEGKISEQERSLVLAPLFRPSVDGIVKDEGAPDISTASLIAKLLDKK
jgi:hypothetical protein